MNWKSIMITAISVIVGLIAYDMFVKKALKISAYDGLEEDDE